MKTPKRKQLKRRKKHHTSKYNLLLLLETNCLKLALGTHVDCSKRVLDIDWIDNRTKRKSTKQPYGKGQGYYSTTHTVSSQAFIRPEIVDQIQRLTHPSTPPRHHYRMYTISWCIPQPPPGVVTLKIRCTVSVYISSRLQPSWAWQTKEGRWPISFIRTHTCPVARAIGLSHTACKY